MPNGKLDRDGLRSFIQLHQKPSDCIVRPRNELEHVLKDLWCEFLRMDKVGSSEGTLVAVVSFVLFIHKCRFHVGFLRQKKGGWEELVIAIIGNCHNFEKQRAEHSYAGNKKATKV